MKVHATEPFRGLARWLCHRVCWNNNSLEEGCWHTKLSLGTTEGSLSSGGCLLDLKGKAFPPQRRYRTEALGSRNLSLRERHTRLSEESVGRTTT